MPLPRDGRDGEAETQEMRSHGRIPHREAAVDDLSGGTRTESWPEDLYQIMDMHQTKLQKFPIAANTKSFKATNAKCIIISADYMGRRCAKAMV